MDGQTLYGSFFFKVFCEFMQKVFTTSVGLADLNLLAILSLEPCLILLVFFKYFGFLGNAINCCPSHVVVCEANIV